MSAIFENVVCSFCGCLCDDIVVEVDNGHIARVRKVCANGRGLFTHYDPTPQRPTVNSREVEWEEAIAEAVRSVAQDIGSTEARVALAWLRQQKGVVIPIVGARAVSQLKDNLRCLEVTLESEHLERLDEASRIELGFPHDFFKVDLVRQLVYGGMRDSIDNHRG